MQDPHTSNDLNQLIEEGRLLVAGSAPYVAAGVYDSVEVKPFKKALPRSIPYSDDVYLVTLICYWVRILA